ncbi:MAG TPA: hypothetical protein VGN20_25050 [Mucilaginibacter sp.]
MDKKKRLRIIMSVSIVSLIIISWLIYTAVREGSDVSNEIVPEYNNLFNRDAQSKLQTPITFKSKIKGIQTNYILEDRFHVTVFKITLATDQTLNQLINKKNKHSNRNFDVYSAVIDNPYFEMIEYSNKIESVQDIDFHYEGDAIRIVAKNDSLMCYYLEPKTFSLSFNKNSINDIWGQSKGSTKMPISIAFIKKRNVVYCLLLTVNEGKEGFENNLLYSLLK